MRKLQRHILFEIVRTFSLVVTGLTVVLVFAGLVQYAREYGLAPEHMLRIVPYFIPSLLPFTIPATLLLTVTIVYGRVAGDLEMTAAKAAGVNPLSLLMPAFLVGVLLSIVSFVLTDRVGPWAMERIQTVIVEAVEDIVLKQLKNERRFDPQGFGVDGLQLTVMAVDGQTLIRPTFEYRRSDGRRYHVEGDQARLDFDMAAGRVVLRMLNPRGDMADVRIVGTGLVEFPFDLQRNEVSKKNARDLSMPTIRYELARAAEAVRTSTVERDLLTAMALATGDFPLLATAQQVDRSFAKTEPKSVRKLRTEFYARPAMACSCFLFALLGAPFAVLRGKSQFFTTFLVCFLPIVGVYYPVTLGMLTQTKAGALNPQWAVWVADGLLLVAGLWATIKTLRMT